MWALRRWSGHEIGEGSSELRVFSRLGIGQGRRGEFSQRMELTDSSTGRGEKGRPSWPENVVSPGVEEDLVF